MRLGVVITRNNYYRLLGPVVEAALARGMEVVALHDGAQARRGHKGYEFPAADRAPRFRAGTPRIVMYAGRAALLDAVAAAGVDAVVAIEKKPDGRAAAAVPWTILQFTGDLWRKLVPEDFTRAAGVAVHSDWWVDFALDNFRDRGLTTAGDAREGEIRARSTAVGMPELDQIGAVDPEEIRRRLGIPAARPVVLYLPYPFHSNPATPWSRWAYAGGNRAWRRWRLRRSSAGDLVRLVDRGWDDVGVTRAVREFADANDALLVVKARAKDPVPRYLRRVADQVLYDRTQYPATIVELLAVAGLCVHFYSFAILEAVAVGVPRLSIAPELDQMGTTQPWHPRLFGREEGMLFQFKGVAATLGVGETIEQLPRMRLGDWAVDGAAREAYLAKFLGPVDGRASARLLDLVAGATRAGAAGEA